MLKLGYNTTDTPVLVDEGGYTIGGRSWGAIETTDSVGKVELDAGRVVLVDEDAARKSERDDVVTAVASLDSRRAAQKAAEKASKDELVEALDPAVVESLDAGADGTPSKDDLVDAAVDTGADLESGTTKKSTSRRSGQK